MLSKFCERSELKFKILNRVSVISVENICMSDIRTIEEFYVDDEFNWEFLKGVLASAGENNAALQNNQDII